MGALEVPVLGVISDAQPTELPAVAEGWPTIPHQICQFHALREAGRLIYTADHRVQTARRMRLHEKTHEDRQNLHKRLREAEEKQEEKAQAIKQVEIREAYAARGEGALHLDSLAPFQYGGLAMQDAVLKSETSLETLEKGGRSEPNVQEASQASQNDRQLA